MNKVPGPSETVGFVLKGYPRLSETFIAQEIRELERRGLNIVVISLRRPTESSVHPVHTEIHADVLYVPEYLYREPLRVFKAWLYCRRLPGYRSLWRRWIRDLERDRSASRVRRFGQALVLCREAGQRVHQLHAHFMHTPGSVACYASRLLGITWSCSAHAKDIWTTPEWETRTKLADCAWLTTCTLTNADYLRSLASSPDKIVVNYHGLDTQRFPSFDAGRPPRDGSNPDDPVVVLSVGRAVDKKGYHDVLPALAELPASCHWRFVHIGDGACLPALQRRARELRIDGRVAWLGAMAQPELLSWYRQADVFVLASRVSENGDRDGLPNVLLEALSQRLAVVTTTVSGIPELIHHDRHGLLVTPADTAGLTDGLYRLITDPQLRNRLGDSGDIRVRKRFSLHANIGGIAERFGLHEAGGQ